MRLMYVTGRSQADSNQSPEGAGAILEGMRGFDESCPSSPEAQQPPVKRASANSDPMMRKLTSS